MFLKCSSKQKGEMDFINRSDIIYFHNVKYALAKIFFFLLTVYVHTSEGKRMTVHSEEVLCFLGRCYVLEQPIQMP